MKQTLLSLLCGMAVLPFVACSSAVDLNVEANKHDMEFPDLAVKWDEAMPLGNATVGSLVWEKDSMLRMSINRTDLWDLRQSKELEGDGFSFKWLYDQVMKGDYAPVQKRFDFPYNGYAGPSKIAGAGLEFPLKQLGDVDNVHLYQRQAVCQVSWKSGASMKSFVHATEPLGWFVFDGVDEDFNPQLVAPVYDKKIEHKVKDQSRHDLCELGYAQGQIQDEGDGKQVFQQEGWDGFTYKVALKWKHVGNQLIGVWSATSSLQNQDASAMVDQAFQQGITSFYDSHLDWWNHFYSQSSISVPDAVIEKQYYNEVYKMGCIARNNSYPISLQSVWSADNGRLPPWKGDYHHDLNTQLSYWPFYTGNYLDEGYGFLHTLWNQRDVNKAYTKEYFGTDGLNVPGVCTLLGRPMGGWCQYSLGPTVSAWLSHHFYLHWKYSQDRTFLKERAYPYLKDVATYLEQFTVVKNGVRTLPLSSSPEFKNNSIHAWFKEMTNFDRALVHFAFGAASELAAELGLTDEASHWQQLESELPDYLLDKEGGMSIAKDEPYVRSHRHFSHMLAIHPLGLLDKSHGEAESKIIDASVDALKKYGPRGWTGYSYSWFGLMNARAFRADDAAEALRTFAECFCLRNGFHANGDQSKTGKSGFTYRPFTLEGNMAFASGVQEMLLQSHTGLIRIFPAVPASWKDVSFRQLRAMGAFLVSAEKKDGSVVAVTVCAEKGGNLKMANPFTGTCRTSAGKSYSAQETVIEINDLTPGEVVTFTLVD